MSQVKEFIDRAYRLISPNSPTQTPHGKDLSEGISLLNSLLKQYGATGGLLTIAQTVSLSIPASTSEIVCGPSTYTPTPDITTGRLANLENAWLELDGTVYPLVELNRDVFLSTYRYEPLEGLPQYVITYFENEITTLRLYPATSQAYTFYLRGKFEKSDLVSTDDIDILPPYFLMFLYYALARELAFFKGRSKAWTPILENMYQEKLDQMMAASEMNLSITGQNASMLNGAHRVRAGV